MPKLQKHSSRILCNSVHLNYVTKGDGGLTFLFIHNTGGDHRLFLPQLKFFSQFGKVIIPDMRGHGKSDKPNKSYTIETISEDLICLCKKLKSKNVIAIGSSTGGNVALTLGCEHPKLIKASVMIDCAMFLNTRARTKIQEYRSSMLKENILPILEEILDDSCLDTDNCRELMWDAYRVVPFYVWEKTFASLLKWDRESVKRIKACRVPILYIQAGSPYSDYSQLADLKKFYKYFPTLMTGKVVGSGHYPSLEVPNQINAMIMQFLKVKNLMNIN